MLNKILSNTWVRYVLILLIGMGIGAIFYPTKTITKEETRILKEKIEKLETQKKDIEAEYSMRLRFESRTHSQFRSNTNTQINSLKEENYKLKSKVTEKRFKIVKPDGTVEERWFKESETDVISSTVTSIKSEYTRKVSSIEKKWKSTHETRVKKLKEHYEKRLSEKTEKEEKIVKKEKTEINAKDFGISFGLTNTDKYFSSISYDIFGPFFLDMHLGTNRDFESREIGLGIGIRF